VLDLGRRPDGHDARVAVLVATVALRCVTSNNSMQDKWDTIGFQRQQVTRHRIPMRGLCGPGDIAVAACLPAARRTGRISGQVLSGDGGHA
jgi:hypothetical protein